MLVSDHSEQFCWNVAQQITPTFLLHCDDVTRVPICLISPTSWLFIQNLFKTNNTENKSISLVHKKGNPLVTSQRPVMMKWFHIITLHWNHCLCCSVATKFNTNAKAVVYHNGDVFWWPPVHFKSTCSHEFRSDSWHCTLTFRSWSYPGDDMDIRADDVRRDKANST